MSALTREQLDRVLYDRIEPLVHRWLMAGGDAEELRETLDKSITWCEDELAAAAEEDPT